jgi:cation diffusion facilitator family transporter
MSTLTIKDKQREILISLLLSLVMLTPLLVAAVFSNSVIALTDLLQESCDSIAVSFSYFAIRKISRGKNLSYNFGYGKLEGIASLVVAGMILISLLFVVIEAVESFMYPIALAGFGIYVGITTNLVDGTISLIQWRRLSAQLKTTVSPIIEAQMSLFRAGFIASAIVSSGLLLSLAFHETAWGKLIDPIGALMLALFLVRSFYELFSSSMSNLMDKTLEEGLQIAILRALARNFDLYDDLFDIRSRRSGSEIYVEIFLGFNPQCTIAECIGRMKTIDHAIRKEIGEAHIIIVPANEETMEDAVPAMGNTIDEEHPTI